MSKAQNRHDTIKWKKKEKTMLEINVTGLNVLFVVTIKNLVTQKAKRRENIGMMIGTLKDI